MIHIKNLNWKPSPMAGFSVEVQDLKLNSNLVYGIVGPNGSGKSSLIKSLFTPLGHYIARDVNLFEKPLTSFSNKEFTRWRSVSLQNSFTTSAFRVQEIVEMATYHSNVLKSEVGPLVERALHLCGMLWASDRPAHSLSGGELQRIFWAKTWLQAEINKTKGHCLILDEPLSNQDLSQVLKLDELLVNWKHNPNCSALVVCHDLQAAARICDKIILMDAGRIVLFGDVDDVFGNPLMGKVFGVHFKWHKHPTPFLELKSKQKNRGNTMSLDKMKSSMLDMMHKNQSIMISTKDKEGKLHVSYSPVVFQDDKAYCYMSTIAQHARNLNANAEASIMWIADESDSKQIFARGRVTFDASTKTLSSEQQENIHPKFVERFGDIVDRFKEMADFSVYEFSLDQGRLVLGFGQAFDVQAGSLDVAHVGGSRQGHIPKDQAHGHSPHGGHGHSPHAASAHGGHDHASEKPHSH
jgi:hypothetical protein